LQENQYIEDEIDLKELFNTIWQKRLFIAIFTIVVTICAVVYAYNKTPIYEVKSIIEIGFIDNQNKGISEKQFLEDPSVLEEKLNVIFNVNDKDINNDPYNGIISSISQVKTVKNFIEIKTEAVSNEIAKEKIKEILEYTKNLYNPKIQQYLTLANTDISNTEKEISFLKNEKIKMLSEKIESSKANLEKYNTEINSLYKSNSSDKLSSMIVSVQMVNYQNLIENAQNVLKASSLEIEQILKDTIPKLDQKKEIAEFKISEQNLTNTRLVGDYITSEYPAKPKKILIIVVAFVTGFILSIFAVFFMQFVSSVRKG
jgi:LPS O-antigen subunit length determinant protein (WzzB/FepE family)